MKLKTEKVEIVSITELVNKNVISDLQYSEFCELDPAFTWGTASHTLINKKAFIKEFVRIMSLSDICDDESGVSIAKRLNKAIPDEVLVDLET